MQSKKKIVTILYLGTFDVAWGNYMILRHEKLSISSITIGKGDQKIKIVTIVGEKAPTKEM
jgi:hypothetical protein